MLTPSVVFILYFVLAAQAALLAQTGERVIVATTNIEHLRLFVEAELWQNIQ
jgi:hypothetical protein